MMDLMIAVLTAVVLFASVTVLELPVALAPPAVCYSIPRKLFLPTMLLALAAGLFSGYLIGDRETLTLDPALSLTPVAVGAALAVVVVLKLLSEHVAVIPSISAAVIGSQIYNGVVDPSLLWIPGQWLSAMVVASLLGLTVFRIVNRIVVNSPVHLFQKLSVLGILMSLSFLLMMFSIGMNLSGLLSIAFFGKSPQLFQAGPVILAMLLSVLVLSPVLKHETFRIGEEGLDTDAAVSLSCVMATSLTMLLFCRGTVLSPAVVMLSAFAGASELREKDILFSIAVAPAFSLLLSFTASAVADSASTGEILGLVEAVSGLLAIVCCVLVVLLVRQNMRRNANDNHNLVEADENYRRLNEMKVHSMQMENEHLQNLLEIRRRDAMSIAERISEQSSFIDDLYAQVSEAEMTTDVERKDALLHSMKTSLGLRRNTEDDRTDFYNKVESLHRDFSARLTEKCPQLSAQERKLATLLRLEFSSKYIAALLNISPKSVEVERHRLRKKLGLTREQNLIDYMKSI